MPSPNPTRRCSGQGAGGGLVSRFFWIESCMQMGGLTEIPGARTLCDLQKNNKLVWDETVRIVDDLFENVWGARDSIDVDNITELTVPVRPSSLFPFIPDSC